MTTRPRSYGLVLLGYSLKPFGSREPLGQLLFSLIDNASTVVIDYAPELERAASQVPAIVGRADSARSIAASSFFSMTRQIAATPYAEQALLRLASR